MNRVAPAIAATAAVVIGGAYILRAPAAAHDPLPRKDYPPRLVCDTVVYYGLARNLCRKLPPGVSDFDLSMVAKRRTDASFRPVIEAPRFCQDVRDLKVLGENWWLRT